MRGWDSPPASSSGLAPGATFVALLERLRVRVGSLATGNEAAGALTALLLCVTDSGACKSINGCVAAGAGGAVAFAITACSAVGCALLIQWLLLN